MTSVGFMGDEAVRVQSIVPGASEASALRGIVPVQASSDEITAPIAVETMAEIIESHRLEARSGEHSKDAVALERGIEPLEP